MKTADDLTFRPASASDAELLASVFMECFAGPPWNEPWSLETAVRRISLFAAAPTFRGIVAIEGSHAVALALGQIEGWTQGNLFLLQEMCVLPDRQGSGIGSRLLDHLLSRLRDHDDVIEMYLLTDAGSEAESFYLGRGFRRSDRKVVLRMGTP
jgi:aminoglycoside 6'-N-acetyltransferase I